MGTGVDVATIVGADAVFVVTVVGVAVDCIEAVVVSTGETAAAVGDGWICRACFTLFTGTVATGFISIFPGYKFSVLAAGATPGSDTIPGSCTGIGVGINGIDESLACVGVSTSVGVTTAVGCPLLRGDCTMSFSDPPLL